MSGEIPAAAIEAAARSICGASALTKWEDQGPLTQEVYRIHARAALKAAAPQMLAEATDLIHELTDPDDCQFDHHGNCQAHGYSLEQGEICPQFRAKVWALGHRPVATNDQ